MTNLNPNSMVPDVVEPEKLEEYLTYLDALRETGAVNMFGAYPYLMKEFGLDKPTAKAVWVHWTKTFTERHEK
jgi:hypothetical protein